MRERTMSDESEGSGDESRPDPDYSFDGFEVVFLRKVALMAPDPAPTAAANKDSR